MRRVHGGAQRHPHGVRRVGLQRRHPEFGLIAADPGNQAGLARRNRAGLVQDQFPRPGQQLQDFATLDQDPAARRPADGYRQGQRRGQSQGTGTGDDQQSHRVVDGSGRLEPQPDRKRGGRQGQYDDHKPDGNSVGELDDRRLPPAAFFDQLHQPPDASLIAYGLDTYDQPRSHVHGAGADGLAGFHRHGPRFAAQQRLVQRRVPGDHDPVDRHRIAGADFDQVSGRHGLDRHFLDPLVDDPARRRGSQRKQQLDRVPRPALLAALDPAPHQQQEHEHGERIEVDLAAVQHGIHGPRQPAGEQPQGNRQVQVGRPRPHGRPGAAEEQAAGPREGDDPEQHAGPAEQPRVLGFDPGEHAAVQGKGQGHHVAGTGGRDADADQEAMVFAPPQFAGSHIPRRMRRIAQRVQQLGDPRQLDAVTLPTDSHQAAAHVQPRLDHAGQHLRQLLDQPDAGRAMHALEIQFRRLRAIGQRLAIQAAKHGVVVLAVLSPGRARRHGRGVCRFPQAIEAVQPTAVDHLVHRPAALTAELLVGPRFHQPRRHGQSAVGAADVGRARQLNPLVSRWSHHKPPWHCVRNCSAIHPSPHSAQW